MNTARFLILFGLILWTGPMAQAGDDFKPNKGFKSLFNGKDLTGWRYPGQKGASMDGKTETPDGRIEVKDAAIVMKAKDAKGKGGIRDLYTGKSFASDFVLKMQFRAGPRADSGVYLRGPQLQIRDFIRRGEQKQLKNFKNDDWNDLVITVKGTVATYTLNGEKLNPAKMNLPARGPIGLQAESGQFEFRHIQVIELPGAGKKSAKKKKEAFTDPAEAGPDFKIQGEYQGELQGKQYGAQVVALGNGKFDVYFLEGGLPGAGWNTKIRIKVPATTAQDQVKLTTKGWTGTIGNSLLAGKSADSSFILKQVFRKSPTLGARPPEGSVILFDGKSADQWQGGKLVEGNFLACGTTSKKGFASGKLHLEFRTPFQPSARGQGRGNSGVYILGREIQVLDSFGLKGENNECGGFYGSAKPAVNMCLPPLSWQTYDVEIKPGDKGLLATVRHNGVKIHENYPISGSANPAPIAPIHLQNHGNPVVYRNIWFLPGEK